MTESDILGRVPGMSFFVFILQRVRYLVLKQGGVVKKFINRNHSVIHTSVFISVEIK